MSLSSIQRRALRLCAIVAVILASRLALTAQASPASEAKPKAIGALGIGWTYIYADVGAGERESINGWYARPSINLPHSYSLFADFTNYYGTTKKGSLNSHGDTFGIAKKVIDTKKISSSVFAESGVVRTSNVNVVNQFAFNAGFNLSIPINKRIAFTMTPRGMDLPLPQWRSTQRLQREGRRQLSVLKRSRDLVCHSRWESAPPVITSKGFAAQTHRLVIRAAPTAGTEGSSVTV